MTQNIRIIGTLMGNMETKASDRTKYGLMFEELGKRLNLVEVYSTALSGADKWLNAVQVFHPKKQVWRQRFYKNLPAFRTRSRRTAAYIQRNCANYDLIFQVGVLYNARWGNVGLPSIIYTDYTAHLSRQKQESGRSPFSDAQSRQWIDLEREAFQQATHICTRGEFVRQSIIDDYGILESKVTAIGGGLNFVEIPPKLANNTTGTKSPTALFIGKDFYRKGGDILLAAFEEARKIVPNAKLQMVTASPDDIPTVDGVEIIAPIWDRNIISNLFQKADFFVLPSRLETWGDVLLEAMAYQLPCIGVSGEAMGEIIEHEQTGLVVSPDNISELSQALVTLYNNPIQRQKWGQAGRERLEKYFLWEKVIDRVAPIAEEILAKGKPT